mmetsp:Transcript_24925/g.36597  ORF Transcript_24925/g.36597 Transcript_24925/m.36597 type:complete len:152 (+) Transcript_24925:51-506(+)
MQIFMQLAQALDFVWHVYVPGAEDWSDFKHFMWTQVLTSDFKYVVGIIVVIVFFLTWVSDQRKNTREASKLRERKKEFLRLQKKAIAAGYLPKDQAVRPEALDIPTTSVSGRSDHRETLQRLLQATKALKDIDSKHKVTGTNATARTRIFS